jgi:diguanylate cyclase (GGDEF)-like protein
MFRRSPGDPAERQTPVQHQADRFQSRRDDPRPVQHALEQALSITTAVCDDDVFARTLRAACDITGADVAVAVNPAGRVRVQGDPDVARRLVEAARVGRADGMTTDFTGVGLPSALTARLLDSIVIIAAEAPDRLGPEAATVLALLVAHAQAGLRRIHELVLLAERANCDPLTGLRHYRPFEERLAASIPSRTAVITVDVDNFKRINDEHGHQAGDRALVTLVDALRGALRGDDHIYRIGGDEFAVVIDVAGTTEMTSIARRLLDAARLVGHTVSVGAAMRLDGESGRETLLRADKALYQAKRAGRNTARLAA